MPASPGRGYPLQATQRAQFGRLSATGRARVSRVPEAYQWHARTGSARPRRPGWLWQRVPLGRQRRARPCRPGRPWQCVRAWGACGMLARIGWVPVAMCSPREPVACSSPCRPGRPGIVFPPGHQGVVLLAGLWRARGYAFLAGLRAFRSRVGRRARAMCFRRGVPIAGPSRTCGGPSRAPLFARTMRRTGNVAASIRRRMARLALRAGLRVRRTLSPHSSGDRATASGAVCVGSNPTGASFSKRLRVRFL